MNIYMKNVIKGIYFANENKTKENVKDLLFNVCIFLVMVFYTLNNSVMFLNSIKSLLAVGIIFGIGKMVVSYKKVSLTKRRALANLSLFLVSIVIIVHFMRRRDTRLLIALFTMFVGIDVKPEKTIKVMFFAKFLTFIFVILTGGYRHINSAALQGGMIILLYICMRGERLIRRDYIILFISYFFLVLYTRSGTVLFGIGIAIFALGLTKTRRWEKLYSSIFIINIFLFCLCMNYFFAISVNEAKIPWIGDNIPNFINQGYMRMIRWVDIATSNRFTLAKASLQKFGISMFGGNVDYSLIWPGIYFNLDSGMMWLLQGWGIIITIVFMILSVLLMKYLIKTKRYCYVIAAVSIALWATQEDMLVSVGTNFLMILMGQAVRYNVERSKHGHTKINSLLLVRGQRTS